MGPKMEQAFVGKCLALFGSVGQRAVVQPPRTGTIQESMDRTVSMAE